ncbi:condensation domain-containing protein, partial [Streptomyces goshikiensis]
GYKDTAVVRRHVVLRCEFRRLAGELSCAPFTPAELALDAVPVGSFDTSEGLRGFLTERFTRSIDTLSWPLFTMGAVLREDSATVYLAFDHIVCDGMSMPIVVREVLTEYEALRRGLDAGLPAAAPSYLDFADEQLRRNHTINPSDENHHNRT